MDFLVDHNTRESKVTASCDSPWFVTERQIILGETFLSPSRYWILTILSMVEGEDVARISPAEVSTTPSRKACNPSQWARNGCFYQSDMVRGRGRLRYELRFRFPSALLLNGDKSCHPGRRFEDVLNLFKRLFSFRPTES